MADEGKEISVEGNNMKSENGDYSDELVVTNFESIGGGANRHRIVKCSICFKTTRSDKLEQHMNQHLIVDVDEVLMKKHLCSACSERFTCETLLDQHRLSMHNIRETLQKERNINMDITLKAPLIEITRSSLKKMGKLKDYQCTICMRPFSTMKAVNKHEKSVHSTIKNIKCKFCGKPFRSVTNRRLHMKSVCPQNPECRNNVTSSNSTNQIGMGNDVETPSKNVDMTVSDGELVKYQSMWKDMILNFRMSFDPSTSDLMFRLERAIMQPINKKLENISQKRSRKYYMSLRLVFRGVSHPDILTDPPVCFNTETFILLPGTNIEEQLDVALHNLQHQIDTYERNGSGWVIDRLIHLDLNTVIYNPLRVHDRESNDESELDNDD